MRITQRGWASVTLLAATTTHALAGVAYQPGDIGFGDEYRLVFVTSVGFTADADDINVYNDFVQSVADVSGLAATGLTWNVIGSTFPVDARDNTGTNPITDGAGVPVYTVTGQLVANDNADLWDGSLINPIAVTEHGLGTSSIVYTGSHADGTHVNDAPLGNNPGFDVETTVTGFSTNTDPGWMNLSGDHEDTPHAFYAMSTVRVGVPTPAAAGVLGVGALALACRRRRAT